MNICVSFAVVVTASLLTAATADASDASDARQKREARVVMRKYAECVVKKKHDLASKAILSDADNDSILRHYQTLIDGGCLAEIAGEVKLTFGGDLYRYALAEALVDADFGRQGPANFSDRLPLAHLLPLASSQRADFLNTAKGKKRAKREADLAKQDEIALLSRYGECIARADPVASRLWLLTRPDGPEETSRINVLRPAFASCLGVGTVRFSRVTMRGLVALNYYRLAMATSRSGTVH